MNDLKLGRSIDTLDVIKIQSIYKLSIIGSKNNHFMKKYFVISLMKQDDIT